MEQPMKDNLAAMLGITPEKQQILDTGSNHPFSCRCPTCLQWWVQMGPEEDGTCGPFTAEEVLAASRAKEPQ